MCGLFFTSHRFSKREKSKLYSLFITQAEVLMNKKEKNSVLSLAYALNGMTLAMNMMMLTAFYADKEDFPPFNSLQEFFEEFEKCIQSAADPDKKGNFKDVYDSGKKYLAEYKAFKKLPEVQVEYLQDVLETGIKEINKILNLEDEYKNL